MEFIPKYIKQVIDRRSGETITAADWNSLFTLLITQGDHSQETLDKIAKEFSNTEEVNAMINQRVVDISSADMTKSTYDKDNNGMVDIAESVVDGSINTDSIKNGAVTEPKLSEAINTKISYMYNKISQILIMLGADLEIEGTADLILFGIDGILEVPYNSNIENLSIKTLVSDLDTGATTLQHISTDAETLIAANTNYEIVGDSATHSTRLSSISNAELAVSNNTLGITCSAGGDHINTITKLQHIDEDYFGGTIENASDTYDYTTLFIARHIDNVLTVTNSLNLIRHWVDEIMKINGHTVVRTTKFSASGVEGCGFYELTKTGVVTKVALTSKEYVRGWAVNNNGDACYINEDNDINSNFLYKNSTLIYSFGSNTDCSLKQLNGTWAIISCKNRSTNVYTYYWFNMLTSALTIVTELPAVNYITPDPDGIYSIIDGAIYSIDLSTLTKVYDIENLPTSFAILNSNVIANSSSIYKIVDNKCIKVYDLSGYNSYTHPNSNVYTNNTLAINEDCTLGVLAYRTLIHEANALLRGVTFTFGSVTLGTPNTADIDGIITIERKQKCLITKGTTRKIYLKPTTNSLPYNSISLIIYLNRALATGDSLAVSVKCGSVTNTITAETSSTNLVKYYNAPFVVASSDIEIVITTTANSSEDLQIEKILGGADNEI